MEKAEKKRKKTAPRMQGALKDSQEKPTEIRTIKPLFQPVFVAYLCKQDVCVPNVKGTVYSYDCTRCVQVMS